MPVTVHFLGASDLWGQPTAEGPDPDAAALVDISTLGGNSMDDILSGQYRCHVAATLTGKPGNY